MVPFKTSPPKVIWEKRVVVAQLREVSIGFNGTPYIYPQNYLLPSTITTRIYTPIPRPTPLTTPNGIRIQSAVLPQYTFRLHRETDGISDNT